MAKLALDAGLITLAGSVCVCVCDRELVCVSQIAVNLPECQRWPLIS